MPTPGEAIREALQERGWTQAELCQVIRKPVAAVNEVIQGKRGISPEMAISLACALGKTPEHWMALDAAYWISQSQTSTADIASRARLFDLAPVKEMQRRGWIKRVDSTDELELELKRFFETDSLDSLPHVSAVTRRTDNFGEMNSSQKAWCFRARRIAKTVPAGRYSSTSIERAIRELRKLITWPEEARKVSRVLGEAGIRFVIVEHLPQTKIDGAALWLDEASPVIAMSLRFDRIDSFWHTLGHELSHIRHRDSTIVDDELVGESRPIPALQADIEQRADHEAAATWIPDSELDDFVTRIGPLYDRVAINQFANRIRVHPSVIIGQLQHRGELSYGSMRTALGKIRDIVTAESLTDGWGHTIELKD